MKLDGCSAKGSRAHNEDSFFCADFSKHNLFANGITALAVVSDGTGGPGRGDTASDIVSAEAERYCYELLERARGGRLSLDAAATLEEIAQNAHDAIQQEARKSEGPSMGATFVAAFASPTHAWIGHVGDSRAYLVRDGRALRLTEDHSKVGRMLREGAITEQEAQVHPERNKIDQALGLGVRTVEIDETDLAPGDVLLLCSDGVHAALSSDELAACVQGADDAAAAAKRIVRAALSAGTDDNATALVVLVSDSAEAAGESATGVGAAAVGAGAAAGAAVAAAAVAGDVSDTMQLEEAEEPARAAADRPAGTRKQQARSSSSGRRSSAKAAGDAGKSSVKGSRKSSGARESVRDGARPSSRSGASMQRAEARKKAVVEKPAAAEAGDGLLAQLPFSRNTLIIAAVALVVLIVLLVSLFNCSRPAADNATDAQQQAQTQQTSSTGAASAEAATTSEGSSASDASTSTEGSDASASTSSASSASASSTATSTYKVSEDYTTLWFLDTDGEVYQFSAIYATAPSVSANATVSVQGEPSDYGSPYYQFLTLSSSYTDELKADFQKYVEGEETFSSSISQLLGDSYLPFLQSIDDYTLSEIDKFVVIYDDGESSESAATEESASSSTASSSTSSTSAASTTTQSADEEEEEEEA